MIECLVQVGVSREITPAGRSGGEHGWPPDETLAFLRAIADGCVESMSLETCERLEAYLITASPAHAARVVHNARTRGHSVVIRTGHDGAEHLFRVAGGLESRLIGEPHILGQIRRALERAVAAGRATDMLPMLTRAALMSGRRVRNETAIGNVASSCVSLAVQRVFRHIGRGHARIGLVGTGSLARELADSFQSQSACELIIASRHGDRAAALANTNGRRGVHLDALAGEISRLDAIVTATRSTDPVLSTPLISRRAGRLLLVDLGVPSNIEPAVAEIDGVELVHLDDLSPDRSPAAEALAHASALLNQDLRQFRSRSLAMGDRAA